MRQTHHRSAFTLIELLVLLSLIAVVIAMILPAIQKTRESNNRTDCQNNLKALSIGIHNYGSANKDRLPPILDYIPTIVGWTPFWFRIRPYVEADSLSYRSVKGLGAGWNAGNHAVVYKPMLCPSDPTHEAGLCTSGAVGWAGVSYAPVFQLFGTTNDYNTELKAHITAAKYTIGNVPDGMSQQAALVERFSSFPIYDSSNAALYPVSRSYWGWNSYGSIYGVWGLNPPQTNARSDGRNPAHPYRPNSAHRTCEIALLDGSVRSVPSTVNPKVWEWLCTPDDGNPLPGCW